MDQKKPISVVVCILRITHGSTNEDEEVITEVSGMVSWYEGRSKLVSGGCRILQITTNGD